MSTERAGWLPDPTGRHERRYWDGRAWTDHVSDRGVRAVDPLASSPQLPRGRDRTALFVVLGVVLLAAVGGAAFVITRDEDEPNRQEYVDAIAASMAEDEAMLDLEDAEFECLAAAQVDIYGVGAYSEAVTAEEIRDHPERRPSDWGIEPTEDQAHEYFDALVRCVDDLGAAFAQFVTSDLPTVDPDAAGACLAESIQTPEVEDAIVDSFVSGDEDAQAEFDSELVPVFDECGVRG